MLRLRVATFNVRNGLGLDGRHAWPFRRRTTARTIAALGADVVGLQEAYAIQQRYLERHLSGYRFVAAGREDGTRGERCPVLARAGLTRVVGTRTRWYGPTPDVPGSRIDGAGFPRIATTAQLEVGPDRLRVDVTSTHLDEASPARRRESAAQLVEWLDSQVPQVVLGDLNADPGSEVLGALADGGLRAVEPAGTAGTEHRFLGVTDGRRIDHVLVSGAFTTVHAEVVTTRLGPVLASDHHPVVALLDLDPSHAAGVAQPGEPAHTGAD